jgi:uncharacterized protein
MSAVSYCMTGKKKRSKKSRKPKIRLSRRKAFVLAAMLFLCGALSIALSVCLSAPSMSPAAAAALVPAETEERSSDVPEVPVQTPQELLPQPREQQSVVPEAVPAPAPAPEQAATSVPAPVEKPAVKPAAKPAEKPAQPPAAKPVVVPEKKIPAQKPAPVPEKKQLVRKTTPAVKKSVPKATNPEITAPETTVPQHVPAEPLFVIPEAHNHAVLVFVFDDAGQSIAQLEKCLALPFPVTIAVLPGLPHSAECARLVRKSGNQVILHQPMQALNERVKPGPGAIVPSMTVAEIRATLRKNIAEIGPVAGLNNHEGSRITENEVQIGAVLDEAAAEGIFFLDSRTTAQTRAPQAALERGMAIYERDVFLDNTEKKADILEQLYRGLSVANKQGRVIMIGHVWSADVLPAILADVYPQLKKKGYRFEFVKE